MKKYAIIGFGGLGKSHFLNLSRVEKERGDIQLAAICNHDIESISQNVSINLGDVSMDRIDFSKYNLYTDYKEMVEKEDLDFAFIALPTHLHAEVSIYLLSHGVHVCVEKPMATTMEECEAMMAAAAQSGRKLMVGQSLRFSGEYVYLKELVENETYGKPLKAEFSRKSQLPKWTFQNWILDESKSGGCIIDLHVHDVDMMQWLFGVPEDVSAVSGHNATDYESVYAVYRYPDMSVSIQADWNLPQSFPFRYSYAVTFEKAYVECINGEITVYTDEEKEIVQAPPKENLYLEEREFVEAIIDGKPFDSADIRSVYKTMKLVFREKELLRQQKEKA